MDTTSLAFALIALVMLIRLEDRIRGLEREATRLAAAPRPPRPPVERWLLRGITALGFAWYLFGSSLAIRGYLSGG